MEQVEALDAIDQAILDERVTARDQIEGPRIGDYVRFQSGELERFSHDYGTDLQTSPVQAGSFFLHAHGNAGFSGSLNPAIPLTSLTLSGDSQSGKFWFFHHNSAGPGRGISFSIQCRVYDTTAEYRGFLSRPRACDNGCACSA